MSKILVTNIITKILLNFVKKNTASKAGGTTYEIGQYVELDEQETNRYVGYLNKQKRGYPLDYIVGGVELDGIFFNLEEGVFIPRPCTKKMIDIAKELIHNSSNGSSNGKKISKVIDICAGSGYIGISLAKLGVKSSIKEVVMIEKSKKAVSSIKKTLSIFDKPTKTSKVEVIEGSAFDIDYHSILAELDFECLILCNPPYVPELEGGLVEGSVAYEPYDAIYSGKDGLTFYKKIFTIMATNSFTHSILQMLFELDPTNIHQAQRFAQDLHLNPFTKTSIIKDEEGFDRFLLVQRPV